jgi:hypothetical protein
MCASHPEAAGESRSRSTALRPMPHRAPEHGPSLSAGLRALDRLVGRYGPDAFLANPMASGAAAELREAVRLLCAEAQQTDPRRAERLVIALRTAWPSLPAVQRLPVGNGREVLLSRVIAQCIVEFYAAGPHRGDGADHVDGAYARSADGA